MIDIVAEHPHYRDHLLPIWEALPDDLRGTDWGSGKALNNGNTLMVAGYSDVKKHIRHKRIVYVEHGAGQSYIDLDISAAPFYSGGPQHRNVVGYICPNQEVADRWASRYPDKLTAVVGCPRLDRWHSGLRGEPDDRTVAITFHWDANMTGVPETSSAFEHYVKDLPEIIVRWRDQGWHVIGHAHPRFPALANYWKGNPDVRKLVEFVEHADGVLDRARVLVADNTSLQAEFLSLGRAVVWVDAPQYRTQTHHGGRFWTWPTKSGTRVDTPASLAALDLDTVPPATWHPYAFADGNASRRAADFLVELERAQTVA